MRFLKTLSQADVFSRFQLCIFSIRNNNTNRLKRLDLKYILYHTHFRSGKTSHDPSSPVPPHGPLRNRLGHLWQHTYPVWLKMHSPQCWHLKSGTLIISSKKRATLETIFSYLDGFSFSNVTISKPTISPCTNTSL